MISGFISFRLLAGVLLLVVVAGNTVAALPRFALLTGTRCSACHFNPTGGGIRNELGFMAMNTVGMVQPDSLGLSALSSESNTFWEGVFAFGFDARLQVAKTGRPPSEKRKVIPMQLAPAAALMPTDWLTLFGSYNVGKARYPGQTSFDVAALIQPGITAPSLKVGHIQPSVGMRQDDHTMFARREVAMNVTPLLAPNYNEWGAEITYEGLRWLTLNAGAYSASNLSQSEPTVDAAKPSYLGRLQLWPQFFDEGINAQVGGSWYGNGQFQMAAGFGGFGIADRATFFAEGTYSRNATGRQIRNWMLQSTFQLRDWLALEWRYEWAQTEDPVQGLFHANALVAGLQIFPFPMLELRPEYRYFENDNYRMGQWAIQFHLFY